MKEKGFYLRLCLNNNYTKKRSYKDNQKVRPLAAQLSWSNNILIMSSIKINIYKIY